MIDLAQDIAGKVQEYTGMTVLQPEVLEWTGDYGWKVWRCRLIIGDRPWWMCVPVYDTAQETANEAIRRARALPPGRCQDGSRVWYDWRNTYGYRDF